MGWYCWKNPSCQWRFPYPSAIWTLAHQLYWSLILTHLFLFYIFHPTLIAPVNIPSLWDKSSPLEILPPWALSQKLYLFLDSGRRKNGIQVPIHNWKVNLLGKKRKEKEPGSLKSQALPSKFKIHSVIPSEDIYALGKPMYIAPDTYKNIHSSIFRNQKL